MIIFFTFVLSFSKSSSKSFSSTASIRGALRGSKMMRRQKEVGRRAGGWQKVSREWEAGRGILRGWKSIPLDGVTSRAQLALARVSFRRGFRVLTVVDWRFLPVVSFLLRRQLYMYIACVMRWLYILTSCPCRLLVSFSLVSRFSAPTGIFFLFYPLCSASRPYRVHYPIFQQIFCDIIIGYSAKSVILSVSAVSRSSVFRTKND